ncbi:MAG: hypothetical protein ABWY36_03685 [Leifsonia sp.]
MTNVFVRGARLIARKLPEPVADLVLPGRRRAVAEAGVSRAAEAPRRLFIGPVNSAGQGWAWARAAERLPGVSAVDFMYRNPGDVFAFPADHAVPTAFFIGNRLWQREQRDAVTRGFTHVIIESGRHIFGTSGTVLEQIDGLRAHDVAVALLFHGSDLRVPSEHAASEIDSPFHGGRYPDTALLEQTALRNRALIGESGLPVFVSTPDLHAYTDAATWLPVAIDVERWAGAASVPALTRQTPVVVHAPSNAGLKGSELIADTVRRLDAEGLIEYREVRGVPAERMAEVYGSADIVLDQFSLGIYGVAAVEALAAGRLVVSHVSDAVRSTVLETTGQALPVVESRAGDLETVLRAVLEDRERFAAIARSGPGFAAAVHDGRRSAEVIGGFLGVEL